MSDDGEGEPISAPRRLGTTGRRAEAEEGQERNVPESFSGGEHFRATKVSERNFNKRFFIRSPKDVRQ